jgi:hypothetical protein
MQVVILDEPTGAVFTKPKSEKIPRVRYAKYPLVTPYDTSAADAQTIERFQ